MNFWWSHYSKRGRREREREKEREEERKKEKKRERCRIMDTKWDHHPSPSCFGSWWKDVILFFLPLSLSISLSFFFLSKKWWKKRVPKCVLMYVQNEEDAEILLSLSLSWFFSLSPSLSLFQVLSFSLTSLRHQHVFGCINVNRTWNVKFSE